MMMIIGSVKRKLYHELLSERKVMWMQSKTDKKQKIFTKQEGGEKR